jgi:hypothetical protein
MSKGDWVPVALVLASLAGTAVAILRLWLAYKIWKGGDPASMEKWLTHTARRLRGPESDLRPTDHESAELPTAPPRQEPPEAA